jgi:3'-5' exoribonuclease
VKEIWVNQLVSGQDVNDAFVIRKLEAREYNGRKYLSLEFGDKTGRIGGVCWEGADDYFQTMNPGNIVRVEGKVGTYKEMPQITVISMEKVARANIDPTDFLPRGPNDPQAMLGEIDEIIAGVKDIHYQSLLGEVFNDGILRREFAYTPAAKLWHHSYIGGLAEHTLNVTRLSLAACDIYRGLDKDLLISGALLHDIGKTYTYSLDNFFDYTDEGRLIGHIVIADRIICDKIRRLQDFPAEKKKLIRHLILSHQGTYEQASPVLPQTLEANILYILDLLDSRVGGITKVMNKSRRPDQRWSDWVKLIERYIYFGENAKEE